MPTHHEQLNNTIEALVDTAANAVPGRNVSSNGTSVDLSINKEPGALASVAGSSDIQRTLPDNQSSAGLPLSNVIDVTDSTGSVEISPFINPSLPNLRAVSITFNTHSEDDKDDDTVLHVFIKNRSVDTSFSENSGDYISNYLSFQNCESNDPYDVNPYLAMAENIAAGVSFGNNSTNTYFLNLRRKPIPCTEILLPVVNIHILPAGNDTWAFDFVVKFYFGDPNNQSDPNHAYDFSFSSNTNGITGIVLDQDHRNYIGIGTQNPNGYIPAKIEPTIDSVLNKVVLDFHTKNGGKDAGTQVNVHLVNRLSDAISQDIAIGINLFPNQAFQPDPSLEQFLPASQAPQANTIELNATSGLVAYNALRLQDIALPVVNIVIVPDANQGRWMFDFRVRYYFSYGTTTFALEYASTTSGIILDANEKKYAAVYQGDSFPAFAPVGAPSTQVAPIDYSTKPKQIPLSLIRQKLDEIINSRQSSDSASPSAALLRFRLDNSGAFGSAPPGNYYDLLSLDANPTIPGTVLPTGYVQPVKWDHSPSDQGPDGYSFRGINTNTFSTLYDINNDSLTIEFDPSGPTPLTLAVDFETDGPIEVILREVFPQPVGVQQVDSIDLSRFSINVSLTLTYDPIKQRVDILNWVADLLDPSNLKVVNGSVTGNFLGKAVSIATDSLNDAKISLLETVLAVSVTAPGALSLGGTLRQALRDQIFKSLAIMDPITRKSTVDNINAFANSWLLGGATDSAYTVFRGDNTCKVSGVSLDETGGNLNISYTGPQYIFEPVVPAGWPPANEFDPGALSNIDHIVVVMMENRSFDHMLGYLSLPVSAGGMGRTDVDGLEGGEVNYLHDGTACPSMALFKGETVFAPDPPHDFDPVSRAINGGKMDGFAESYSRAHGPVAGPNIMKYHPAANVPTYDALARDFALSDRWFASHPGPTFPNRFHELTGWPNIDTNGFFELNDSHPKRAVFTQTIFDYLSKAGVSWKYFEHHYCFLRFFEQHTFNNQNIFTYGDPEFGFGNVARTGNLPSVTFIDPNFIELPPGGNDDGPPADIRQGQLLIQEIVETLIASPTWEKTMLIITYDEHGGFYDHVAPPPAVQIASGLPTTYGVRIPTFVVSPWVAASSVFGHDATINSTVNEPSLYFDHTSVLKTIAKRFLGNIPGIVPPYMGPRYAAANDLSSIILSAPRLPQFRPFLRYTLQYAASKMCLDVPGASTAPATGLWVYAGNGTNAQDYSFEDAGDGYFYIRTHTGGLYLTAQGANGKITQELKVSASGAPDTQRWKLSLSSNEVINSNQFTIRNASLGDDFVLQTQGNSLLAEAAVILAAPTPGTFNLNPWIVTSASLPNNTGENGPPVG